MAVHAQYRAIPLTDVTWAIRNWGRHNLHLLCRSLERRGRLDLMFPNRLVVNEATLAKSATSLLLCWLKQGTRLQKYRKSTSTTEQELSSAKYLSFYESAETSYHITISGCACRDYAILKRHPVWEGSTGYRWYTRTRFDQKQSVFTFWERVFTAWKHTYK